MLVLEALLDGVETLMGKLKVFGMVAGFKINSQKTKMPTKI